MARPLARPLRLVGSAALAALLASGCMDAVELETDPWNPPPAPAKAAKIAAREECAVRVEERQALFGDLHIHTGVSMDANALGTRATPDDAYRYATGQPIDVFTGSKKTGYRQVQIDRPLDFAAVTDHAEWMAEVSLCMTPGSTTYDSDGCLIYRGEKDSWLAKVLGLRSFRARLPGLIGLDGRRKDVCGEGDAECRKELALVWKQNQDATERFYDRTAECSFTTFHAWEYSRSPRATKIHRNIVLRNEIVPELPISSLETPVEMDLRRQLAEICNDNGSGCEAIAIPHNPNLSNGQMFRIEYADLPLERQKKEAALRARLEPIVEMMQIKGESECRNGMFDVLGGPDELCDFEKLRDNGENPEDCKEGAGWGAQGQKGCTSRTDYVRYALLEGLREKKRLGVNPYEFGFIGSTDNHMATSGGASEYEVPFKFGVTDQRLLTVGDAKRGLIHWNPGGLAAVWAEENTRDSIFDAFKRRETFATSGPRIQPRFFGGWGVDPSICGDPDLVKKSYASSVPMGSHLAARPEGARGPSFVATAMADPGATGRPGGLLQRLQIIKGWVGEDGNFHQEVHDVAGGDNGAAVDVATCQVRGPGSTSLCGVWTDPDFDPAVDAIYYARAVENPSCRWSTRHCLSLPAGQRPDGCDHPNVAKTIQERAWTSPIWYGAG